MFAIGMPSIRVASPGDRGARQTPREPQGSSLEGSGAPLARAVRRGPGSGSGVRERSQAAPKRSGIPRQFTTPAAAAGSKPSARASSALWKKTMWSGRMRLAAGVSRPCAMRVVVQPTSAAAISWLQ